MIVRKTRDSELAELSLSVFNERTERPKNVGDLRLLRRVDTFIARCDGPVSHTERATSDNSSFEQPATSKTTPLKRSMTIAVQSEPTGATNVAEDMNVQGNRMPLVVCASGYFDPIHPGHIEYLEQSKALAGPNGRLVVIVNNDEQASMKKGKPFMECKDRLKIVRSLRCVDAAIEACEKGDRSVCSSLKLVRPDVFTNGGDQTNDSIPGGGDLQRWARSSWTSSRRRSTARAG